MVYNDAFNVIGLVPLFEQENNNAGTSKVPFFLANRQQWASRK